MCRQTHRPTRPCQSLFTLWLVMTFVTPGLAQEIQFDVPALISAQVLPRQQTSETPARLDDEKQLRVVIPVTAEVANALRQDLQSFRFDVYWNRLAYPLIDFAPQTQLASDIDGLIATEKNQEVNRGAGLNLTGKVESMLSMGATAELGKRDHQKRTYNEIPQHEVQVASGSSHRGTGAFFRFHPSKRATLEGARELTLVFRVPSSWRAGILKVECRAVGSRKVLGHLTEPFEHGRVFLLPVYLEGDREAREAAVNLVRCEQGLRRNWLAHETTSPTSKKRSAWRTLIGLEDATQHHLPDHWVHHLIQSGNDDFLEKFRTHLPREIARAADQFVDARQQVLGLSR